MSTALPLSARARELPGPGWWLVAALAIAAGILVHWIAGIAILLWALVQWRSPFNLLDAALVTVTGASFVDYTQGQLTVELALLALVILFLIFCYLLQSQRDALRIPRTPMTLPLLLYLGLSSFNFVRGVVTGQSLRYAGLEMLAALALGTSLIVVAIWDFRTRFRYVLGWMWVVCLGHLALGVYWFTIMHVRSGRLSFAPVPGVLAMLTLPMALKARTPRAQIGWSLFLMPLFLHQFLSFTRGYWLGLQVGILFTVVAYCGIGPGSMDRWRRTLTLLGLLLIAGTIGATVTATALRIPDLAHDALVRFQSSGSTRVAYEASSNIVRLSEYAQAWPRIREAWLWGHGFGYFLVIRDAFRHDLIEQWFIHNNYLLAVLTQGVVGLALLVWLLGAAIWTGYINSRRALDSHAASWSLGTAAATVYVAVYCLVHFPLGEVNTIFALAFAWGTTMRLGDPSWYTLRWRAREPKPAPASVS